MKREPYVKLACGHITVKRGYIAELGDKTVYIACWFHGIQKVVKEYGSPIELWQDMEDVRIKPTFF
jgi:hypothetical protein